VRVALPLAVLALAGCLTTPPAPAAVHFPGLRIETSLGDVTAIVFQNETPATAAFIDQLVDAHYYDGRSFGRVIPGFVIQEVDRTGGTTDQKEHVKLEAPRNVSFSAGAFGIARDADPDSGGSEFFLMDFATSSLYGNYTAFAQVVSGLDVVHAIARVPAQRTGPVSQVVGSPPGSPVYFGVHDRVPLQPVVMTRITRVDVALPPEEAARYPLRVGPSVTTDAMRATLEWPADARAGRATTLTWYVAARGSDATGTQDPPPPDLAKALVTVDGTPLPTTADDRWVGIVTAPWTPPHAGTFAVRLANASGELATVNVTVPAS
jgi:cyclophilin family peptidyl-prolyl cis-trans isomerase